MRHYRSETHIAATPAEVWSVLVDLPRYAEWNPFTPSVRSGLSVGDPVDMRVLLGDRRVSQREWVRAVEEEQRLVWGYGWGPFIWAERVQTLSEVDGMTVYTTVDTIGGLLGPVVHLVFGAALDEGFAAMTDALKRRVEAGLQDPH